VRTVRLSSGQALSKAAKGAAASIVVVPAATIKGAPASYDSGGLGENHGEELLSTNGVNADGA
jgi:hypothetical protein